MKLTPIDIQQQQFRQRLRGFDRTEVSNFLEVVAQHMSEISHENSELRSEVRRIKRDLEAYRERETTLKEAMLTAQRAIDEIREQADKEAQLVLSEAELRAERIVYDANKRVGDIVEDITDLKRQRVRVLSELRGVVDAHHRLLDLHEEEARRAIDEGEASITVLQRLRAPTPPRRTEVERRGTDMMQSTQNHGADFNKALTAS
ncbi:MAG: DivIVA domain-containing protein [Planctomycetales bacterium]|nr:DivIVA domain-containing protein [Planctomycetales bacterium]